MITKRERREATIRRTGSLANTPTYIVERVQGAPHLGRLIRYWYGATEAEVPTRTKWDMLRCAYKEILCQHGDGGSDAVFDLCIKVAERNRLKPKAKAYSEDAGLPAIGAGAIEKILGTREEATL